MEVFDQSRISCSCTISDIGYLRNARYPIYINTIRYEPDTNTDTDIITAMILSHEDSQDAVYMLLGTTPIWQCLYTL